MSDKPTIWRALDRKAMAVAEFTLRQQRKRLSTWVVMGVGFIAMAVLTMFYIDSMMREYEAIDNDGDSRDFDMDGYPNGQENLYGTDILDPDSHPGLLNPPVAPDDPSKWINEDGFDIDSLSEGSYGYDDDGDCRTEEKTDSQQDTNNNNIPCDVQIYTEYYSNNFRINGDNEVDEDPDEDAYAKESIHRAFVLALGKFGFVFLIGIFVPLFMATGLIRDEMSSGTMHYMLSKPIARSEVFLYRILGFLGLAWPYMTGMVVLAALVTGFFGPSEGLFRFGDLGVWMAVLLASLLSLLVYAMLFCLLGVLWKHGIILALPFAAWELGMILTTLGAPEAAILRFSVIGWAMNIVDAGAALAWTDTSLLVALGLWAGGNTLGGSEPLTGSLALEIFASDSGLGMTPLVTIVVSVCVMLIQAATFWFIGGALFKSKEID